MILECSNTITPTAIFADSPFRESRSDLGVMSPQSGPCPKASVEKRFDEPQVLELLADTHVLLLRYPWNHSIVHIAQAISCLRIFLPICVYFFPWIGEFWEVQTMLLQPMGCLEP